MGISWIEWVAYLVVAGIGLFLMAYQPYGRDPFLVVGLGIVMVVAVVVVVTARVLWVNL